MNIPPFVRTFYSTLTNPANVFHIIHNETTAYYCDFTSIGRYNDRHDLETPERCYLTEPNDRGATAYPGYSVIPVSALQRPAPPTSHSNWSTP